MQPKLCSPLHSMNTDACQAAEVYSESNKCFRRVELGVHFGEVLEPTHTKRTPVCVLRRLVDARHGSLSGSSSTGTS